MPNLLHYEYQVLNAGGDVIAGGTQVNLNDTVVKNLGAVPNATVRTRRVYDDNSRDVWSSASNAVTTTAPAFDPRALWTGGTALVNSSFTPPTSSYTAFVQFVWPEMTDHEQFIFGVGFGHTRVAVRTGNILRVQASTGGPQYLFQSDIGAVAGDVVSVYYQAKNDNVSRFLTAYQINDGTPTAVETVSVTGAFLTGNLEFGKVFSSEADTYYKGFLNRAMIWLDGTVNDTFSAAVMRDFVDASGALVDKATAITAYGTPDYDISDDPTVLNAVSNNLGSGPDLTRVGTFAAGKASNWFTISKQYFSDDLTAGEHVARIQTNANPLPTYTVQTDAAGLFEIVGTSINRTATAVTSDGNTRSLTIRETQTNGIVRDQTFEIYPAPAGQDTLDGRLTISPSRTSCYTDEHIFFSLDGLFPEEQALLYIEWDFADATEVYVNTDSHPKYGVSAQYAVGSKVLHTFTGSTGVREVTVRIYRPGVNAAVWTGTVSVTVLDVDTVTNSYVVAHDSVFTGAPTGTQSASFVAALTSAEVDTGAGEDAIIYLKGGGSYDLTTYSFNLNGRSCLVRSWGGGSIPVLNNIGALAIVQDAPDLGSFSVADVNAVGSFDAYNVFTVANESTWNDEIAFLTLLQENAHVSMTRIKCSGTQLISRGGATDVTGVNESISLSDCEPDSWTFFGYYMSVGKQSGVDGGRYIRKGAQPNISKAQWAIERPADGIMSSNGPGRVAGVDSMVIQRQSAAGFHGWSDANTASALQAQFGSMSLTAHQPVCRFATDRFVGERFGAIQDCRFEGYLEVSADPQYADSFLLISRNYIVGHAGTYYMLELDAMGAWLVNNVMTFANTLPLQTNFRKFLVINISPQDTSARNNLIRVMGNTFIDLRTAANFEPGQDATDVGSMFDIPDFVLMENNVLYAPNRTVTDPNIPGLTVVSGETLTTAQTMAVNYAGMLEMGPGDFTRAGVDALTVDASYATPAGTAIEGRLQSNSALKDQWSGAVPAYDFGANFLTGRQRSPGAWDDVGA